MVWKYNWEKGGWTAARSNIWLRPQKKMNENGVNRLNYFWKAKIWTHRLIFDNFQFSKDFFNHYWFFQSWSLWEITARNGTFGAYGFRPTRHDSSVQLEEAAAFMDGSKNIFALTYKVVTIKNERPKQLWQVAFDKAIGSDMACRNHITKFTGTLYNQAAVSSPYST